MTETRPDRQRRGPKRRPRLGRATRQQPATTRGAQGSGDLQVDGLRLACVQEGERMVHRQPPPRPRLADPLGCTVSLKRPHAARQGVARLSSSGGRRGAVGGQCRRRRQVVRRRKLRRTPPRPVGKETRRPDCPARCPPPLWAERRVRCRRSRPQARSVDARSS